MKASRSFRLFRLRQIGHGHPHAPGERLQGNAPLGGEFVEPPAGGGGHCLPFRPGQLSAFCGAHAMCPRSNGCRQKISSTELPDAFWHSKETSVFNQIGNIARSSIKKSTRCRRSCCDESVGAS